MKNKLSLITFLSFFITTGCFIKEKDIGQMFFPISLGISYKEDKYEIYLQVLNTSTISIVETQGILNDSSFVLIHSEGKDINDIFTDLGLKTHTYISSIKLRSIILNDSVFKGPMSYIELLKYFINSSLFRTKVQLYITNTPIKDFYSVKYNIVGTSLYSPASDKEPKLIDGYTKPSYLIDALKSHYENKRMYYFPLMNIKESSIDEGDKSGEAKPIKTYYYDGLCFTTMDTSTISCLNKEEAIGYRWYHELDYLNINIGDNKAPINFIANHSSFKTDIINNTFEITINVTGYLNINFSQFTIDQIKEKINNHIKQDIYITLNKSHQFNIDAYNLNNYAFLQKKDLKYNSENIKIQVNTKLINSSYFKN